MIPYNNSCDNCFLGVSYGGVDGEVRVAQTMVKEFFRAATQWRIVGPNVLCPTFYLLGVETKRRPLVPILCV